jgi:ATP-binding cassette subfamily B protein
MPATAGTKQATADDAANPSPGRWRRALGLIWRASPRLVLAILATTSIAGLLPGAEVLLVERAVGRLADAIGGRENTGWLVLAVALAGLGFLGGVLTAAQSYAQTILMERVAAQFNLAIMEQAARLELADFEDSETYDRLQMANREAGSRPYQMFAEVVLVVTGAVTLVTVSGVLFAWNPWVAAAMVLAPVLPVVVDTVYGRKLWAAETERTSARRRAQYLQFLVTKDKAYKETRILGLTGYLIGRYRALIESFVEVDRRIEKRRAASSSVAGLAGFAATAVAIVLAARDSVAAGDVGRFAGYLAALTAVTGAAQALLGAFGMLVQHTMFLGNLFSFLDQEPTPAPAGGRVLARGVPHRVTFDGVTFAYPAAGQPALRGFDLDVAPGLTVALVGENGAGKTTAVKLLAGLYQPDEGAVLIDGEPLACYERDSVWRAIAPMFQDFLQFEATARENIAFGDLGLKDEDGALLRAAAAAGADGLLAGLPEGLDTQLGKWFEDGHQLSGGEWQRVALARTLLRDAPILLLDEPTAALDPRAEAALFGRLSALAEGRTCLFVAHRLAMARFADKIAVVANGAVQEFGSHAELMARNGYYAELYRLQGAPYAELEGDERPA